MKTFISNLRNGIFGGKVAVKYSFKNYMELLAKKSQSKMELFAKTVNGFQPLIIITKIYILDVWLSSVYPSNNDFQYTNKENLFNVNNRNSGACS